MAYEDIISAAELLMNETASALYSGDKLIWSSPAYSALADELGAEKLHSAAAEGGGILHKGIMYTVSVSPAAKGLRRAEAVSRPLFEVYPELKNCFTAVNADIRNAVTAVAAAADDIYAAGGSDKLGEKLEIIDRSMLMLYSEILIPEELIRYGSFTQGKMTDLSALARKVCSGIAAASGERHFSAEAQTDEGCFALIREETLRIILCAAAAEVLKLPVRADYFRISVKQRENDILLTAYGGSIYDSPDTDKLFEPVNFMDDFKTEDLFSALIFSFSKQFGCRPFLSKAGNRVSLGLILPKGSAPTGGSYTVSSAASEIFKAPESRFSPEKALTAHKFRAVRYK